MLRIVPSGNSASARSYYTSALRREDYYTGDREVPGLWHGRGAELLGLTGEVQPDQFGKLLENRHPVTGAQLTPRTRADRLCGWDMNFHAPKSLSTLQAFAQDSELVRVFREAVAETMSDIESLAATRVRRGGRYEDRLTTNLCWSEFVHFTARPVSGIPDPHLHIHAFVQNLTMDPEEGRWKAVKNHDIKKEAPFFQELFHSRLARKVAGLGYSIRRTRHAWEVVGLSDELLAKFSRRTAQIDAVADAKGITDARSKDGLGARTRAGKRKGLTHADLLAAWDARLHEDERTAILHTYAEKPAARNTMPVTAADALAFAEGKCFDKASVVKRSTLLTAALRYGVGHVLLEDLEREMGRRDYIERSVGGELLCTRGALMVEEAELITKIREGRGRMAPMQPARLRFSRDFLSREQKEAVRHILRSNDQVIAIRGVAGAGKTTLMQEVREQIEKAGLRVHAFAPSAAASRGVLRDEGFRDADTVARLLVDERLKHQVRGQVIFIDEAGLLGNRDMAGLMAIAGNSTRIVLVGDTRQHAPVSRGDSMRLLEDFAGLPIAQVRQIRRQEKAAYRDAVKALSEGDTAKGFRLLERFGAIVEIPDDEQRYRELAAAYFCSIDETGSAPLVVSPTHGEARAVTAAIRTHLVEAGQLGERRLFTRYHGLDWDEAEKQRPENYEPGLVLQFHQNARGIPRGSVVSVLGNDGVRGVRLGLPNGSEMMLDWEATDRFQMFAKQEIEIAKGDLIKITRNGSSANGRRLFNGTVLKVRGFNAKGRIVLENGVELDAAHGHISHGYCHTSHGSQGKTVGEVFVAQSASSFLAASREGFYVSCSRGKESIRIFTDDKLELQRAIGNSSQRLSALEFGGVGKEAFVSGGLDGVEWVKRVAAERARHHEPGTHVQKLAAARRIDPLQKPQAVDFRSYIEMRRANVEADGKSRSKGYGPSGLNTGLKGTTRAKKAGPEKSTAKPETPVASPSGKQVPAVGKPAAQAAGTPHEPALKPKQAAPQNKAREAMKEKVAASIRTGQERLKTKLKENLPQASVKEPRGRKVAVGNTKVEASKLSSPQARDMQAQRAVQAKREPAQTKPATKAPTPAPTMRK